MHVTYLKGLGWRKTKNEKVISVWISIMFRFTDLSASMTGGFCEYVFPFVPMGEYRAAWHIYFTIINKGKMLTETSHSP